MRNTALALLLAAVAPALQAQARDFTPYLIADRASEIALARSAAPAAISGSASVFVLTDAGYVEAAKGTNGFTCLLIRSFIMPDADSATTWDPPLVAPHCFNAEATRTVLPNILYRTKQMFRGTPAAMIEAGVRRAYASHRWPTTTLGGMVYMLSPQQRLGTDHSSWKPHLMFLFPPRRAPASWGAVHAMDATAIDAGPAPFSPGTLILIPVSQWSDGTPYQTSGEVAHQH
jgi:hypothetical protein